MWLFGKEDIMGRPVFSYELEDPDFCWLLSRFQESFPQYTYVENGQLPVVFVSGSVPVEHQDESPHKGEEIPDLLGHPGKR